MTEQELLATRPWSEADDERLCSLALKRMDAKIIGMEMNRSPTLSVGRDRNPAVAGGFNVTLPVTRTDAGKVTAIKAARAKGKVQFRPSLREAMFHYGWAARMRGVAELNPAAAFWLAGAIRLRTRVPGKRWHSERREMSLRSRSSESPC
jgi:hypothetical protein